MAERRPPGFNVDLGFYDSSEVLSIPRKVRAAAVGVWTLCGAYAANKLSDGHVPEEKLRELGCTPTIREALKSTKPEPLWVDDEHLGGIRFTRWAKWQRTCGEVKAYREADAERKRRAREAKRKAPTSHNAETSARTSTGQANPVRADSRTPKTETETETETKRSTHLGTEATDPSAAGISATPGADLVRETIPKGHPPATLTSLRLQASELINTGTDPATVRAALQLWCDKPGIGIGRTILASLASEAIKSRASPRAPNGRAPASDAAFAAAQALKTQPARLELE